MSRWDMNVAQCKEVSHAAHGSLFATTEQLQIPHTAICQSLMQPMIVCLPIIEQVQVLHPAVCKSLMQSMTVSLPQLNCYRCHTNQYASLSCSPWRSVCYNWMATNATQLYASLSCSPRQSVCHNCTATDATHSCMPVSHAAHDSQFASNWTATNATHTCMPVSHAAHNSLFATIEQLQMPHTAVCQSLMQPMTVCLP